MLDIIHIDDIECYDYVVEGGFVPLLDSRFSIDINLRVKIQRELFGHSIISKGDVQQANNRFYHWVWENKRHVCEETYKPLMNYSSVYISHIIARGAAPDMAHDPRNTNILCYESHNLWDTGTISQLRQMRIYEHNMFIIELLKKEYQQLK